MADAPTTLTFQVTDPNYGTLTWTPGPHILGHLHEPPLADYYQDQGQLRDEVEQILSKELGEIAGVLCAASQIIGHPFAMAMLALESAMAQLAADDSPLGTMSARFSDDPHTSDVAETLAMFAELGIPVIEVGQMGAFDQGMSERIDDLIAQRPAAATDE